jgi:HSP20 family protein
MTLMRFDPFRELDRLSEQVMSGRMPRTMTMEAWRRGDEFFVQIDLPGVDKDDVDLTVEHNVVSIRAQRRPAHEEGDDVIVDERPHGTFTRQTIAVPRRQPRRRQAVRGLRPRRTHTDDPDRRGEQIAPYPAGRAAGGIAGYRLHYR